MNHLRVAFVSEEESSSRSSWSGIPHSVREALLAGGVDLVAITPKRTTHLRHPGLAGWFRGRPGPGMVDRYSLLSLKSLGTSTWKLVREAGQSAPVDFVLSIHPDPIAYARLRIPCGFIGDCNFPLLAATYPAFARQSPAALTQGERMWRQGLAVSRFAALASDWAVGDTRRRYPDLAGRVRVLPFGTNVRSGWSKEKVERQVVGRKLQPLRLLTVGTEWERKRMSDAIAVVVETRRIGLSVVLDIVGCMAPEGAVVPEGVTVHGRLNRANHEENRRLEEVYESAHVFLLASQAECFGIVFGEAATYGLPSIGVGSCGIPSAVRDGVTGRLLPAENWCVSVAAELKCWVENPSHYQSLSHGAWRDARDRLDWTVYADRLLAWIREFTKRPNVSLRDPMP